MAEDDFDPLAGFTADEQRLGEILVGYFEALAEVDRARIYAALQTGSAQPLIDSRAWSSALQKLTTNVEELLRAPVLSGFQSGVAEIPSVPRLGPRVAELALEHAGEVAVSLVKGIDDQTRAGLRQLIGRASSDYAIDPSLRRLRRLEAELKDALGVTPKQASRIDTWRIAARQAGLPEDAIAEGVATRTESARIIRARALGEYGVIESINSGRHQSWVEARDRGDLPATVQKRWQDQGDRNVRPLHRAQTIAGPIPLDAIYPIQQVLHPPSKDPGCRCWDILVVR